MLSIQGLDVSYGPVRAVKSLSLQVDRGEIVSLIGANGAGKSTVLRSICGLTPVSGGKIYLNQQNITGMATERITKLGLAMVPEGRRIFQQMTVEENLLLGATPGTINKAAMQRNLCSVYHSFPRLAQRRRQIAGTLSGGEQQMLAIGRALMSVPHTILLDEPSMGLAPILVEEIFQLIKALGTGGLSVLLVEQNASMALSVSHRVYVLENGTCVMSGTPDKMIGNDALRAAYLGGGKQPLHSP